MSEELLSKKELLEATGISYGQLYRWKRKDLIPEEWFIRKSTFTGQETFFPKEKILERIDKIQKMKENLSLDEMSEMFSPSVGELNLSKTELVNRGLASETTINLYLEQSTESPEHFQFEGILTVYIVEKLLQSGEISLDEAKMVIQVSNDYFSKEKQSYGDLIIIRKLGVSTCFIVQSATDLVIEQGTKQIVKMAFSNEIEELRTKLL
ncbi:YhbD family protein [Bacillus timonensis]|uniref:YhbD family protein n=1 Tax=Bacillus timonensis TaxID=1033734 RepID=UPI000288184B|nr:YhbD family protein [Bacillus timonensis]